MQPAYWQIVEALWAIKESLSDAEYEFVERLFDDRPMCLSMAQECYLCRIWLRHHNTAEVEPPWDDGPVRAPAKKSAANKGADGEAAPVEAHHRAFQKIIAELKGK
jgi:hypothetical protein